MISVIVQIDRIFDIIITILGVSVELVHTQANHIDTQLGFVRERKVRRRLYIKYTILLLVLYLFSNLFEVLTILVISFRCAVSVSSNIPKSRQRRPIPTCSRLIVYGTGGRTALVVARPSMTDRQ